MVCYQQLPAQLHQDFFLPRVLIFAMLEPGAVLFPSAPQTPTPPPPLLGGFILLFSVGAHQAKPAFSRGSPTLEETICWQDFPDHLRVLLPSHKERPFWEVQEQTAGAVGSHQQKGGWTWHRWMQLLPHLMLHLLCLPWCFRSEAHRHPEAGRYGAARHGRSPGTLSHQW